MESDYTVGIRAEALALALAHRQGKSEIPIENVLEIADKILSWLTGEDV